MAELLGAQAICMRSPFRESLILRMRYPKKRFLFQNENILKLGSRLEVELLEDEQAEAPIQASHSSSDIKASDGGK